MKNNRSTFSLVQSAVIMSVIALCVSPFHSMAQKPVIGKENKSIFKYRGIEGAFGVRYLDLNSDIPELQDIMVAEEGGRVAFLFGNSFSRVSAGVGLFYSTAQTRRTIDQLSLAINGNVYLLKALRLPAKKADLYFCAGYNNQYIKFYGHYIDENERAHKKGAAGREPYLGKIMTSNVSVGVGFEYRLEGEQEFIHLFAEGRSNFKLSGAADVASFDNTTLANCYAVNIGVRFGRKK